MGDWIINHIVLSGAVIPVLAVIIGKLIPTKTVLQPTFRKIGKIIAMFGRGRLGKLLWRFLRNIIIDSLDVIWSSLMYGVLTEWDEKGKEIPPGNPKHSLIKKK